MVTHTGIDNDTVVALHLSHNTYQWLTQSGHIYYRPEKGIRTIAQLLRCEAENLYWLPRYNPMRVAEVKRMLAVHGRYLAEYGIGPCIAPPAGDEWVRMLVTRSQPSWVLRSELPDVPIEQLVSKPLSILKYRLRIQTVGDLLLTNSSHILDDFDWTSRRMNGQRVLSRLNHALEQIGLRNIR